MSVHFYIQNNTIVFPNEELDAGQFPYLDRAIEVYQRICEQALKMELGPEVIQNLSVKFFDGFASPHASTNEAEPSITLPMCWLFHPADFEKDSDQHSWLVNRYASHLFSSKEKLQLQEFLSIECHPKKARLAREFTECHELAHIRLKHQALAEGENDALSKLQELEADALAVSVLGTAEGAFHLFNTLNGNRKELTPTTHPSFEERLAALGYCSRVEELEVPVTENPSSAPE